MTRLETAVLVAVSVGFAAVVTALLAWAIQALP
jgi:hypothetical protein